MTLSPEQQKQYIEIWSKVVETQMHFNEMCVKSRQLGLTFVTAALGVGIVLLSRGSDFSIKVDWTLIKFELHASVILVIGAFLALWAVRVLDLNVYHKMLRGAVTFGEDFEEKYMKEIFDLEKGMTQAISHYSRYKDANKVSKSDMSYSYVGTEEVTAENQIKKFYNISLTFLAATAIILLIITSKFEYQKTTISLTGSKAPVVEMRDQSKQNKPIDSRKKLP